MSKKNKNKIRVRFIGNNSTEVTGSCIHIKMNNFQLLLECGCIQGGTIYEDYKANHQQFDFKPKNIDYVFIGHEHIDHIGLLPRLYAEGFRGRVISPIGTKEIMQALFLDCSFIMKKDCETLKKKFPKKNFFPCYEEDDIKGILKLVDEYQFDEIILLNDNISFQLRHSGHIINSSQIELWLTESNHTKKILYTSDLGNISVNNYYVNHLEKINKSNLVIGECTYSKESKKVTNETRNKDLEKIKSIISQTIEQNGSVLIPCFSLHRMQEMITNLYMIYSKDISFDKKIILSSPLANTICDIYSKILTGEKKELFDKVMNWDKLIRIRDFDTLQTYLKNKESYIYLASSGFMIAGSSRTICSYLLGASKNAIILSGYAPEGSLSWKIKTGTNKYITIDGKVCKNLANAICLTSFSSHLQYYDLLDYYSNINCEKIALVHGEQKNKLTFAKTLQEEIAKKNKTTRVIETNKNTEILL